MREVIISSVSGVSSQGKLTETNVPEEAIKDADIIVTDTWTSMGWEEESAAQLEAFAGYQITNELAKRGGVKDGWNSCIVCLDIQRRLQMRCFIILSL